MGILFTLLGVTNTGKTTQQKLLEEHLKNDGYTVVYVKYPRYETEPTGPRINAYLRGGNPEHISAQEFHELQIQNKFDFEPKLVTLLSENDIVLAEMYTGTGITYGMGDGISKEWLIEQYAPLRKADISILLDGKRFMESKEEGHHYENDDEKTEKIRLAHLELANDFGWTIINANQTIDEVHQQIYSEIKKILQ